MIFFFGSCALKKEYPKLPQENIELIQAKKFMIHGNYKAALEKNQKILRTYPEIKDEALFQIGLIYAHPKNPDKNYEKSLKYFQEIIKKFPKSHLRNQAKIWILVLQDIIKKDKKIKEQNEKIKILMQKIFKLEKESKIKDEKIKDLKKQIEKLKEIDLTIEEKKRKSLP